MEISQINLKIPTNLREEAQRYVKTHGYTNIQELIRESLRDKLFNEKQLNPIYVKELLNDSEYGEYLSIEESEKSHRKLMKKAGLLK